MDDRLERLEKVILRSRLSLDIKAQDLPPAILLLTIYVLQENAIQQAQLLARTELPDHPGPSHSPKKLGIPNTTVNAYQARSVLRFVQRRLLGNWRQNDTLSKCCITASLKLQDSLVIGSLQ